MRILALFLSSFFFILTFSASAEMAIQSVSGYSKEFTDVDNAKTYYAGMAGNCNGGDGTNICDTCETGTGIMACSRTNAYPALRFIVRATFTGTLNTTSTVEIDLGSNKEIQGPFNLSIEGGNTLVVDAPWSVLCQINDGSTTCANGLTEQDLTIRIPGTSGEGGQSTKVRIGASFVDSTTGAFYQECAEGKNAGTGEGWCYARTKAGDGKVYFEDLYFSLNYPGTGASRYDKVVMFYEVNTDGRSDSQVFDSISIKSPSKEISIEQAGTWSWTENNVSGFSNGQRVCFRMANQDVTGVIKYFTPNSADPANWCETPTAVIGLLDGKNCFIATAAFGSDMAPEVEWIRKFRNEYLLNSSWGKSFVKFYYKNSPPVANWIAQNDTVRFLVRTALWPVLAFSWISVQFGIVWATLFAIALTSFSIEMFIRLRRRFKLRNQV